MYAVVAIHPQTARILAQYNSRGTPGGGESVPTTSQFSRRGRASAGAWWTAGSTGLEHAAGNAMAAANETYLKKGRTESPLWDCQGDAVRRV